jgi:hypothetical protein
LLFLILLAALTVPLVAEGAGGVEYTQTLATPNGSDPAWSGYAVGGYGYGVLADGSVIGGFGMGSHGASYNAGYGGTMQGWQHRWGPLLGLFTTKIGFGGVSSPAATGFSMLGAAEVQLGVLVLPWFEIGFKTGAMGTVTFAPEQTLRFGWSPVVGARLAWGAF